MITDPLRLKIEIANKFAFNSNTYKIFFIFIIWSFKFILTLSIHLTISILSLIIMMVIQIIYLIMKNDLSEIICLLIFESIIYSLNEDKSWILKTKLLIVDDFDVIQTSSEFFAFLFFWAMCAFFFSFFYCLFFWLMEFYLINVFAFFFCKFFFLIRSQLF